MHLCMYLHIAHTSVSVRRLVVTFTGACTGLQPGTDTYSTYKYYSWSGGESPNTGDLSVI